ncbi:MULTISPECIES: ParA family protein [Halomonadaceae]|jgi:chromosome partitioning protein|uniref:Partition protein parA n=1 Tax=Halomonas sp. ZM3 TaxID=1250400 RepID=K7ST97_9GAMM|nr:MULTISPECIES: ParA family protein [unclassified Halomonas]AFW03518.1 partition protein parA [Halomonas sp. ZM3]PKG51931.1 ParA family protein [Halomonas sp. MES3-P3E]
MGYIIGVVSQKGGVGKSTISRAVATTYAAAGWNVKVADLDINQASSFSWLQRRLAREVQPVVAVETFGTVDQALKIAEAYDMMILDGAPHATRATMEIGKRADLVVLPTGLSLDDLEPTVLLANALSSEHGVSVERIAIALVKTGDSPRELDEARSYLAATPYFVLDSQIPEKTAFRRAQDGGLSVVESPYKGPREQADKLIQAIIDRLESVTQ